MKHELENLASKILRAAGSFPVQIFIRSKQGILARFTNNGVHQNGFQNLLFYAVRASGKKGFVSIESNDLSKAGIKNTINQLKVLEPHPTPPEILKRSSIPNLREHFPIQMEKTPEMAASAIEKGIHLIESEKASANGYYSAYERLFYFADSRGQELFHPATAVRFGVTAARGSGKGYSSFYHADPKRLDVISVAREATQLAKKASVREISIKPGIYECIFSPRAFLELIEPIRRQFDAQLYRDGKSIFSGSLGSQIFSRTFTLSDDVTHPKQFGVPFDVEGTARKKVALIKNGVLKGLLGEGHSSRGISEHAFYPENLVGEGGRLSLNQLFRRVKRGIYINKIRYHTLVRETGLEVTGLATAGSLYIEKGQAKGRVGHLRYHDSLFSILQSLVTGTREQTLLKDGEMGAALLPYYLISKLHVV